MRRIRRSINVSNCDGHKFNYETGEFEDFSFSVEGNYSTKRATNYARKQFHDSTILITNVEIEQRMYAITPEDFIKYGERIK